MPYATSADGTRIAYDRSGSGPAVVLVDGAMCHRAFGPMPALAPLLAPHLTVFLYDRRGRNESGDTQPYAVEREIEDMAAVIAEAGDSAMVFGISSGAALAVLATAAGLPITRLALYEPPYRPDTDETIRAEARTYRDEQERSRLAGQPGEMARRFFALVGTPPEAIEGMAHSPMWPAFEAVAPTLAYDAAIMDDNAVPVDHARAIGIPTLIGTGGASPDQFPRSARELADAIPDSTQVTLDGQTHEVDPAVLAPVLLDFFTTSHR
ncbi:MAG TPA: alpha/beta fold hydrolase [Thermomicrobiales bacterium]|jgi:pimeloyl-ACP methyl ester carboxylesterase|nr:alpha/beta fold hydrolase [Thermomicrobiales bacterium]